MYNFVDGNNLDFALPRNQLRDYQHFVEPAVSVISIFLRDTDTNLPGCTVINLGDKTEKAAK
jgi:hypothetical protein